MVWKKESVRISKMEAEKRVCCVFILGHFEAAAATW